MTADGSRPPITCWAATIVVPHPTCKATCRTSAVGPCSITASILPTTRPTIFASAMSAWCLVNSGTAESGYGYWYPAKANDGATGGGFIPEAWGRGWIGKTMPRGAWHYSAEEDVGYVGALRTHAAVVVNDPVFGDYAYGGILTRAKDSVRVIARDG